MPEMITIAKEELTHLEERAKKLAMEKSYLQLVTQLMNRVSSVTGLENMTENLLKNILDVIGGANIILYYRIDNDIFYTDVYGKKMQIDKVEDELVKKSFESRKPIEVEHDFSDTKMMTPEFTRAYTWAYPLMAGPELIGVFKMESLSIAMKELYKQLPAFFNYTAILLKNEILGHTRLKKAYNELEAEMAVRREVEEELRSAKEELEERVLERTEELSMANEGLRESEKNYADLYDNAPDMYLSVDARTAAVLRCNQTAARTLGYAKEEIIGRVVFDLYHPDCTEDAKKAFHSFVETGEVHDEEFQVLRKDGSRLDVSLNVSAVRDEDGKIIHSRSTWRDITERKQAEDALRESEARLAEAQRIAHIGSWELDLEKNELIWSDEIYRIFGLKEKGFGATYEAFLDAVHPNDRELVDSSFTISLKEETPYDIVHRIIRKSDGDVRYVQEQSEKIKDESGKIIRVIGTVQDITERKKAEEKLSLSRGRARDIINNAFDAAVEIDEKGLIISWNPQAELIFGWKAEDVIGKRLSDKIIPPQYREAHLNGIKKFLTTGEGPALNKRLELTALHCDGYEFPVEFTVTPIHLGESYAFSAFMRDITERKKAEEELEKHREHLEELVEDRTEELRKKTIELEGFNRMMLNREERVIELKEEVNELCRELGREETYPPIWGETGESK